jgi:hypothetical protein
MGLLPLFIPFFLSSSGSTIQPTAASPDSEKSHSSSIAAIQDAYFEENLRDLYQDLNLAPKGLNYEVFSKGYVGYLNLKGRQELSEKPIITIVDFEKPSTQKRLWILDLNTREVLFHTYVAHGRGSGDNIAQVFSNINDSHMSSLGFYVTAQTYYGQHGLSLKLEGKDKELNCKALERNIVVHGAKYVSEDFIRQHGRLGRSHGCPALPEEITATVIDLIKDQTTLFIHGKPESFTSDHLDQSFAKTEFFKQISAL